METPLQIPKEQLKHCPYCGAQIPLVSNECLFCGKSLTNITKPADDITPNDDEIKNCPDCGAPFPLLSNICTSCGHVLHQQRSSEINITNLLAGITECINRIKNLPKPTLLQTVFYWIFYIMLFIDVAIFIYSLIFDNYYLRIFCLCGFVGCGLAIAFVQHKKWTVVNKKSPVQIADEEYYKARYAHDMYLREVEAFYGDNKEAQKLLNDYSTAINNLRIEKNKNRAKIYTIISSVVVAFILSVTIIKYQQNHHKTINITIVDSLYVSSFSPSTQDAAINDFVKRLMPYPQNVGVETKISKLLKADHYAEFTIVKVYDINNIPVYRWKVNNVKISSTGKKDKDCFLSNHSICLKLLDKNHKPITHKLSKSYYNKFHYIKMAELGKGNAYVNFWSLGLTSSFDDLKEIADKAMYYTITLEP
ncbi:MAG: zinc ribbon domain-containing protein [Bacteroidales bacterium]|nr:zinc ribbon domain-containing protein [Bacteroidales bacterium]